MSSVLLITGICDNEGTGRSKLRFLNLSALKSILGNKLSIHQFTPPEKNRLLDFFQGRMDGQSEQSINELVKKVINKEDLIVFVDGSNYGTAIKEIKKANNHLKVIVFYHNVESVFFKEIFKKRKTLKSLLIYLYYNRQELISAKNAFLNIFLTQQDRKIAAKLYKTPKTTIIPLCTQPSFSWDDKKSNFDQAGLKQPLKCLFLGGAFYANVDAAHWIYENLQDLKDLQIKICGKGFDKYKAKFETNNIEVTGFVNDVSSLYNWADVVINPVFSGSGMKTKVAEALYYGKKIISTFFGANGYEAVFEDLILGNTTEELIQLIQKERDLKTQDVLNYYAEYNASKRRNLFQQYYSHEALKRYFTEIL